MRLELVEDETQNNIHHTEAILLKLFIIGESKTEILDKFMDEKSSDPFLATIGLELRTKIIKINEKYIKLQLCIDTHTSRFSTVTPSYCKGVDGVVLVYDITQPQSLADVRRWLNSLDPKTDKIILANGCREVDEMSIDVVDEGMELSAQHPNTLFLATDSQTQFNIEEAFYDLALKILSRKYPGDFSAPTPVLRRRSSSALSNDQRRESVRTSPGLEKLKSFFKELASPSSEASDRSSVSSNSSSGLPSLPSPRDKLASLFDRSHNERASGTPLSRLSHVFNPKSNEREELSKTESDGLGPVEEGNSGKPLTLSIELPSDQGLGKEPLHIPSYLNTTPSQCDSSQAEKSFLNF